jgi:hypothetical protein
MKYAKAVVGALIAAGTSLQASYPDGWTGQEYLAAGLAGLIALTVVWAVPNVAA